MISFHVALVPGGFWIFLVFVVMVAGMLVFYALYSKVDVKAVFSHGKTTFQLEAKGHHSNVDLEIHDPGPRPPR
jgi:hypothetical protein